MANNSGVGNCKRSIKMQDKIWKENVALKFDLEYVYT